MLHENILQVSLINAICCILVSIYAVPTLTYGTHLKQLTPSEVNNNIQFNTEDRNQLMMSRIDKKFPSTHLSPTYTMV